MKEVMATQTPGRYLLKSDVRIFTSYCYSIYVSNQTQFAGTNDGLVNLLSNLI